jgi:polysaccharide deacetylase family protein (PEP-CTERM system associated)
MILLSVDIESWVHRPIFKIPLSEQTKELDGGDVLKSSRIILDMFRRYRVKATFFVLGVVAEWYHELIEEIKADGHEIGIHGYTHKGLNEHDKTSFNAEMEKTVSILNSLGVEPRGYRSPFFSRADFLYDVLKKNGITYDSSIFPIKTPLYDGREYSCRPFIISNGILEIPCSMFQVSKLRIPVGGFYLRLFGGYINSVLLDKIEKRYGIAVMYFHPWELLKIPRDIYLNDNKRVELPFVKNKFAYYKIPMKKEVEYLMGKFTFTNFEGAIGYINETILGQ